MVVEALAAHGRADAVHRWLDLYRRKLEDLPGPVAPVTGADWREALGDPRRAADWIGYFGRALAEQPWRNVLAVWWPRLLPGMYGGSTHPVIRVGHAVRAPEARENAPRLAELAHGLGYWAARHRPGSGIAAARSLDAVPPIADPRGGFPDRLAAVRRLPLWADDVSAPDTARARLAELVRAATHRYATHGHGEATMLVHAATAPNAVLRTLGSLPRALWAPSLHAAWTASAAVTAMYATAEPVTRVPAPRCTALDVGDGRALAAALRAVELSEPLVPN
jgi:hypothetical protein